MLHVTPLVFSTILQLIEDHPIFINHSNNAQTPVEQQLAITLHWMGHYDNAASVEEVAYMARCGEGSVKNFTNQCFTATEGLHDLFVHHLTPAEKEVEKRWMDENPGFKGKWQDGWLMYNGTCKGNSQIPTFRPCDSCDTLRFL